MNTGIKLDFGESKRHLLSLLLKTKRSDVLTLKNLRGKALTILGPFLVRELVALDLARLETTTGGICWLVLGSFWAEDKPTILEPHYFGVLKEFSSRI
jgi:hypothetical protein